MAAAVVDPGERKLATIRRVLEKSPIKGADRIELVTIDGWQVIAKKEEFQVGDQCVYFEIDSFLPVEPHFEFLRDTCFKHVAGFGEGFRLRTRRLRGELSQGLALAPAAVGLPPDACIDGADVTALLRVRKYEIVPIVSRGPVGTLLGFPTFLIKTDQERIQNCYNTLKQSDELMTTPYEVTLKLDGSSMTVFFNNGQFGVCSRNYEVSPTSDASNAYLATAGDYKLEERMRTYGRNIALQGELMGPGINGNRERLTERAYYLFDVIDIDRGVRLFPAERMAVLDALNAITDAPAILHCPVVDAGLDLRTLDTIKACLAYAERPSIRHSIAEGVVLKTVREPMRTFKIISNRYLLKCEE